MNVKTSNLATIIQAQETNRIIQPQSIYYDNNNNNNKVHPNLHKTLRSITCTITSTYNLHGKNKERNTDSMGGFCSLEFLSAKDSKWIDWM